jgi:hypothetical protein
VTLLVNDAAVFSTGFGPPCQWVKGSDPLPVQIGHDQLHGYPLWNGYPDPAQHDPQRQLRHARDRPRPARGPDH